MAIDEVARRRFVAIAGIIAKHLAQFDDAQRKLNESALTLEIMLNQHLDGIERASGETLETKQLRSEIEQAWKIFDDDAVMPAIEASKQYFDDCANKMAQLVGALPKTP